MLTPVSEVSDWRANNVVAAPVLTAHLCDVINHVWKYDRHKQLIYRKVPNNRRTKRLE